MIIQDTEIFCYVTPKYMESRYKLRETNDCTVVAFAESFNTTYEKAHTFLKYHVKRVNRDGLKWDQVKSIRTLAKNTKTVEGPYTKGNSITLNQFIKNHPVGRYFVCVHGHALAVIDGRIMDVKEGKRRKVIYAMRVYR